MEGRERESDAYRYWHTHCWRIYLVFITNFSHLKRHINCFFQTMSQRDIKNYNMFCSWNGRIKETMREWKRESSSGSAEEKIIKFTQTNFRTYSPLAFICVFDTASPTANKDRRCGRTRHQKWRSSSASMTLIEFINMYWGDIWCLLLIDIMHVSGTTLSLLHTLSFSLTRHTPYPSFLLSPSSAPPLSPIHAVVYVSNYFVVKFVMAHCCSCPPWCTHLTPHIVPKSAVLFDALANEQQSSCMLQLLLMITN